MKKILTLAAILFSIPAVFAGNPPKFDHVVIVMMENHPYSDIIGSSSAPYINSVANAGALFTQSFAITHPSQPNYLDLYSGSDQGVSDDYIPSSAPFTTANLGASLIAAGYTFKGYSEDLPGVGFKGASSGAYARKHCPWVNWQGTGINQLPDSVSQPFTSFPSDFSKLPTVSFVIPNLNDDMHDGSIPDGDTWLKNNMGACINWAAKHNSLVIITWDEDDNNNGNQIATFFSGAQVLQGSYSESINHYNVLRTVEAMYGLTAIANSAKVSAITDVWSANSINTVNNENNGLIANSQPGENIIHIQFTDKIPEGQIVLCLTDMSGRELATDEFNTSKEYSFHIPARPAGCYILTAKGDNFFFRKKMFLPD